MRSYMKYNTVIYGFYRAKKGIDFGKSLFVLENDRRDRIAGSYHLMQPEDVHRNNKV